MAVFFCFLLLFFCPNKIRPKKLFNDCLFFKEKTPQLFVFAIVYLKKMCSSQSSSLLLEHISMIYIELPKNQFANYLFSIFLKRVSKN